jgi:hypothetical protein
MADEEIVMINETEYTDKGAWIAECVVILGMHAMLREAEVIKIANIADVLTSLAELIEDAVVIEAFEPLAGIPDWGDSLFSPGLRSIPELADSHSHHLTRTWHPLDANQFTPASGRSIGSSATACRDNTTCRCCALCQCQQGNEDRIRCIIL